MLSPFWINLASTGTLVIEVWNKVDQLPSKDRGSLRTAVKRLRYAVVTTAVTKSGLDPLTKAISQTLDKDRRSATVAVKHEDGRRRAWLYEQGVVVDEADTKDGTRFTVRWSDIQAERFSRL